VVALFQLPGAQAGAVLLTEHAVWSIRFPAVVWRISPYVYKLTTCLGDVLSIPLVNEAEIVNSELHALVVTEIENKEALDLVCLIRFCGVFVKDIAQEVTKREAVRVHDAG